MSKILIATIGSRGDVQPLLALAVELKSRGHDPRLCVPPDFQSWIESYGIGCIPIGPSVKGFAMPAPAGKRKTISRAQARHMVSTSVQNSFRVLGEAAKAADLIMVANPLQVAGRSIAELRKIPYVYLAYSTNTLPSWNHAPPRIRRQRLPRFINGLLWTLNDRGWNSLFRGPINEQRAAIGLSPIDNLSRYVFTEDPWLAADPVLAPAASNKRTKVFQPGSFFLRDSSPLPDALEQFLNDGEPPICFGFGSRDSPKLTAETMLHAARKLGRRAILSQGWSDLEFADSGPDCISIGDVDYEKLFPRVAAVVHHGGSGTTTAVARAGRPQVIVPHAYDQFYWADRVERLGIGASIQKISGGAAADQLARAVSICMASETALRAQALEERIEQRGVAIAAEKLELLLRG